MGQYIILSYLCLFFNFPKNQFWCLRSLFLKNVFLHIQKRLRSDVPLIELSLFATVSHLLPISLEDLNDVDLFWQEDHNKANDIDRLLTAITVFYLPHILYAKIHEQICILTPKRNVRFFVICEKLSSMCLYRNSVIYRVFLRCEKAIFKPLKTIALYTTRMLIHDIAPPIICSRRHFQILSLLKNKYDIIQCALKSIITLGCDDVCVTKCSVFTQKRTTQLYSYLSVTHVYNK